MFIGDDHNGPTIMRNRQWTGETGKNLQKKKKNDCEQVYKMKNGDSGAVKARGRRALEKCK